MKNTIIANLSTGVWILGIALFSFSCSQFDAIEPTLEESITQTSNVLALASTANVTPIFWEAMRGPANGGNLSCSDIGDFEFSSGRNNYDKSSDTFENAWPEGLEISVKDGKFVSWNYTGVIPSGHCLMMSAIVKGGPGNNVYSYPMSVTSGSNLIAPATGGKNANTPDVSNLTFCWNFVPCPSMVAEEFTCVDDTAFAGSTLLSPQGGWYYLMHLDNNLSASNTLWAGKTKDAGQITIAPKGNASDKLLVTIQLKDGFSLQTGDDNWYIHGYTVAPDERPKGGQAGSSVTYKKGEDDRATFTIEIDRKLATIFAVHVNVQECN